MKYFLAALAVTTLSLGASAESDKSWRKSLQPSPFTFDRNPSQKSVSYTMQQAPVQSHGSSGGASGGAYVSPAVAGTRTAGRASTSSGGGSARSAGGGSGRGIRRGNSGVGGAPRPHQSE